MTKGSPRFQQLSDFIRNRMRMSHIYQPVMLKELLLQHGEAQVSEIANSILSHDPSQTEYYAEITKGMVGTVLSNHGITEKQKENNRITGFTLVGYSELTQSEVSQLIEFCQGKLDEYVENRGERIWRHRRKSGGYISGTVKYEVLKRAKFRCELCGISAEEKALEVDHIVPRNLGGSDDLTNLQALCFSCNAMKKDRDDTDFRGIAESYTHRESGCPFCEIDRTRVIASNELVYAIRDGYPVTELHTLVIPKRHVGTYFELYQPEINAVNSMLDEMRDSILKDDGAVTGFNIGMNNGEDSGQTVFHCHVHLIPRRKGDIDNPRGGVRGVIPEKRIY